jgi:hypothetical protein
MGVKNEAGVTRQLADTKTRDAASSQGSKSATVRVNFDLERDQHVQLKVYAARAGKSIADVLRDLVSRLV